MSPLATSFLLISYLQIGLALKCYNCTESLDKNCADPFNKASIGTVLCGANEDCVKLTAPAAFFKTPAVPTIVLDPKNPGQAVQGVQNAVQDASKLVMHRQCKPKKFCEGHLKILTSSECHECEGELCNSSLYVLPSLTFISFLYVVKEIISKWVLN